MYIYIHICEFMYNLFAYRERHARYSITLTQGRICPSMITMQLDVSKINNNVNIIESFISPV